MKKSKLLPSPVVKRSVMIGSHKTSISLEADFYNEVRRIAERNGQTITQLIKAIDNTRGHGNLSSAIRVYVFRDLKARLAPHTPNPGAF